MKSKIAKPNAAVQYSLKNGDDIVVANRAYRGRDPKFFYDEDKKKYVKLVKGIPFVRV